MIAANLFVASTGLNFEMLKDNFVEYKLGNGAWLLGYLLLAGKKCSSEILAIMIILLLL